MKIYAVGKYEEEEYLGTEYCKTLEEAKETALDHVKKVYLSWGYPADEILECLEDDKKELDKNLEISFLVVIEEIEIED